MEQFGRIQLLAIAAIAYLILPTLAAAQTREDFRVPSFELTLTQGAGLTTPDASLASIQRADAVAYRGMRPIMGLSLGYRLRDRATTVGLDWSNISMEANLQSHSLLSEAAVDLFGIHVVDYHPFIMNRMELFTYATLGAAHASNVYTTLTDSKDYGKAQAWGLGLKLGCGVRYRCTTHSAVELKGGAMDAYLFKWSGDEAVIHPEAYTYNNKNNYGLFYAALSYSLLF